MAKPVLLLAFANERQTDGVYLRNLPVELNQLKKVLEFVEDKGICEVEILPNATLDNLVAAFQREKYRDRIAVFHYSGHADSYELLLEEAHGESATAVHGEGLVPFLANQKSLQFIFINGCFSARQAEDLVQSGVPAVIGTVQAVNDRIATDLSISFYQALAQGAGLEQAWKEATFKVQAKEGVDNRAAYYAQLQSEEEAGTRDLLMREPDDRFPWEIYFREGAEKIKNWNLPDAANDPYFGLPDLPRHYQLPDQPYRFLERYTSRDARIFFGRGSYVRDLFQRLSSHQSAPVIMLYGQSGVGKSSLLAAGVFPRLEEDYDIQYIRRDPAQGLTAALRAALMPDNGTDEEKENTDVSEKLKKTIQAFEDTLKTAEGVAKLQLEKVLADLKKRRIEFEQQPEHLAEQLLPRWLQLERATSKKGLIIILDQVEEVFTRPLTGNNEELSRFLEEVGSIFNQKGQGPSGKLVLAYRKEYDSELEKAFRQYQIPKEKVFLDKLDKSGIEEIVNGLTSTKELRNKYHLEIEEGLPSVMADNLLLDKDSAIAPVLQIILTKLWQQQEANEQRLFSIGDYQQLQEDGILLGDFFKQQMTRIKAWEEVIQQKVETSGLALDLLNFHTTALGTAESRSLEDLRRQYNHKNEILEELIQQFKELYLLTDIGKDRTGLAHDTLAPIVQKEINDSDKPGQRALRIIQTKVIDYQRNPHEVVIDPDDLALVEEGADGMRIWMPKEKELIEKSRAYRAELERIRILNRRIKTGLSIGVAIFAVIATLFWYRNWKEARINGLMTHALEATRDNPTEGLRLAEAGYQLNPSRQNSIQVLNDIYTNNYFYQKEFVQKEGINAMTVSSNGQFILTGGNDSLARLWSADGRLLQVLEGHGDEILTVAISPDGKRMATAGRDKTIHVWDQSGKPIMIFNNKDRINDLRFSSDSKRIVSASSDKAVQLWLLEQDSVLTIGRHQNQVLTAAIFEDQIISGDWDGKIMVWRIGQEQPDTILSQHEDRILKLRFSPDGRYFASASRDGTTILWDRQFKPIATLRGHQFRVNDLAFSPEGQHLVTVSDDKKAILWDHKGNALKTFAGHRDFITGVQYMPEGQSFVSSSMDGTIKSWPIGIKEVQKLSPFKDQVYALDLSSDGKKVLVGVYALTRNEAFASRIMPDPRPSRNAYLFNQNGDTLKILQGHRHGITSVALSPDDQYALTGSNDGTAVLWDLSGQDQIVEPLYTLDKHNPKEQVMCVAFSPDGQYILTGSADHSLILWNIQGDSLQTLSGHQDFVMSATFSPDGAEILSGSFDGTARRWNLNGETLQIFNTEPHRISKVAYSPKGDLIAASTWGGYTKMWTISGREVLKLWSTDKNQTGHPRVHAVCYSPNGQLLATAEGENLIRILDLEGNVIQIITENEGQVHDLTFSPDQKYIYAASADRSLRVYYSLSEFIEQDGLAELNALQQEKYGLKKASIQKLLASDSLELLRTFAYQLENSVEESTSKEGELAIMDKATKVYSRILEKSEAGHDKREASLAFNHYGKLLLTAGKYGQSIQQFEKINAYQLGDLEVKTAYGLALYLNGQIPKAKAVIEGLPKEKVSQIKPYLENYLEVLNLSLKQEEIFENLFPED